MVKYQRECFVRLMIGLALNVILWILDFGFGKASTSPEENIRMSLIAGSLAVATWVIVVPVFWRGVPWQAPLAMTLILFLPGMVLFSVVLTVMDYW